MPTDYSDDTFTTTPDQGELHSGPDQHTHPVYSRAKQKKPLIGFRFVEPLLWLSLIMLLGWIVMEVSF